MQNLTTCPICGNDNCIKTTKQPEDYEYRVLMERPFRIWRCLECSLEFVWPRPTVSELTRFYPSDYHAYNEDHGWLARRLVERRDKVRNGFYRRMTDERPIRLFDVGTGDCRHFDALRASGQFEFAGVEISPDMAAKARERGYAVTQGTLEDLDISGLEGHFHFVTMYQLVEHVLNPRILFEKAFLLLKPGGMIIGQLPRLDSLEAQLFGRYWAGYHFPRHLQQFTRKCLFQCIESCGFGQVRVDPALHLQAALSLQNLLVDRFHPHMKLRFGKIPYYSYLLLATIPFCLFEFSLRRGGMMNFSASRPV